MLPHDGASQLWRNLTSMHATTASALTVLPSSREHPTDPCITASSTAAVYVEIELRERLVTEVRAGLNLSLLRIFGHNSGHRPCVWLAAREHKVVQALHVYSCCRSGRYPFLRNIFRV